MTATITVVRIEGDDPTIFDVTVREDAGETRHRVTFAQQDVARLAGGATPEATLAAAFRFLLDREPKESILSRFDLRVISRYFPDFEARLPEYLRGRATSGD